MQDTDIVKLNVGGSTSFHIQRDLLTSVPGSIMEAMFSGRHPVKEVDGMIYLNRNPDLFKHVIQYLRDD